MKQKQHYLDSAANTAVDKKVFKAMKPLLTNGFVGNSRGLHVDGVKALKYIEQSREDIASSLKVRPEEVYFTSGATESNNWVIRGIALHELEKPIEKRHMHILCSAIEHASVLNACLSLKELGFDVEIFPCYPDGKLGLRSIKGRVKKDTLLVCALAIGNETGIKNDIEIMAKYTKNACKSALFLSDCTQLMPIGGKYILLSRVYPHVDYFTFSAHKIYGPTGVGCLIARSYVPLYKYICGGAQENGLRGGTHNTAGIVGMAKAVTMISARDHVIHYARLYAYFLKKIMQLNETYGVLIKHNGAPTYGNIVNLNCSSIGEFSDLASTLSSYGIECSSGAACTPDKEGEPLPSHVLLAMNIPEKEIHSSVRISFCKDTKKEDLDALLEVLEILIKERQNVNTSGI